MTRVALKPLPTGRVVFRLIARREPDWPPESQSPLFQALHLSSGDKEEGRTRRGGEEFALLSVWDQAGTTFQQAREIRLHDLEDAKKEAEARGEIWQRKEPPSDTAFGWSVEIVREIAQRFPKKKPPPLEVFEDPRQEDLPGASGHCGIQGLHEGKGEEKLLVRSIKEAMIREGRILESTEEAVKPSSSAK